MAFEIYIPGNLTFEMYINIMQCARAWADGYDRKIESRLLAALAPCVTIDYTSVVPAWGRKEYKAEDFALEWLSKDHHGNPQLSTQHLLGQPYFKYVTEGEVIVEWQQLVGLGRKHVEKDWEDPMCEIAKESNGHSYMQHTFVKIEGAWKISVIKPEVVYSTGNFMECRAPADVQVK